MNFMPRGTPNQETRRRFRVELRWPGNNGVGKSLGRVLPSNILRRGAGLSADSSFGSPLSSFADDRVSRLAKYASRTTVF